MIEYLDIYKDYLLVNRRYSRLTIEAYIRDIKQYFEVSNGDIDAYLEYLYNSGYTASSQNRKLSALNGYYHYLVKFRYLDYNPFTQVEYAKKARKLPDYLTYPEVVKILDYLKNDYLNKAIVEVLYGCGLRVSELVNLHLSDIHYEESVIQCKGKGNKERYVPINKHALIAIDEYRLNFRDNLKKKDDNNILFLNKLGHKLRREYVNVMLDKVGQELHFNKKLHPHLFRHTFSTHMLENGANLRVIQAMLGHEDITTTEIYTHVNEKKLRDDYNKYFDE